MSDIISRFTAAGAEEYTADVSKMADATEQLANANKQVETSGKSLRGELRAITQELAKMSLEGKENTDQYRKLRDEAGKLKDAISDAAREIATAGSDTRGLDKAIRATNVLVGGFTAVQGAVALFGNESENLQKTLLKVNAAMALLNGLQQIQNELTQKDSILTAAAGKAKELYARFTTTANIATKAFVATLSGGLLIVLGLLVANWDKVVGAVRRYTDATYDSKKAAEALKKVQDQRNKDLEYEVRLLRAKGVEEEKILKLQSGTLNKSVTELEIQLADQQKKLAEAEAGRIVKRRDDVFREVNPAEVSKIKKLIEQTKEELKTAKLVAAEADKSLTDFVAKKADDGVVEQVKEIAQETEKAVDRSNDSTRMRIKARRDERDAIEGTESAIQTSIEKTEEERQSAFDREIARLTKESSEKIKASEEYNKEIRRQDTATYKHRISEAEKAYNFAQQFEQSLAQIVDNSYQLQLANLEEKRAKGLITEKEYAKQIAVIQQKQMKANKATGIIEATINGAVAALKAFAELGPIGGAIAAALIAGITATQIALIAKQKVPSIPGFFRGTKDAPPGMKWVGEQGPELINDQGGYAIIPAAESNRIADMYKKWDIPTITVPDLIRATPQYYPPTSERLQQITYKQDNAEMLTELKFISQYIKQGNSNTFAAKGYLKDLTTTRRAFRT